MEQPVVYLITGPMAAGKSTVARLLASRFEQAVYLEGDSFRRNIIRGREEMTPDPSPEALRQLRLRYALAAAAADGYAESGFTVALEDVVVGSFLREYHGMIRSPCQIIVLVPSLDAVAARETQREDKGYLRGWTVERHYQQFVAATPASVSGSTRPTSRPRRQSQRFSPKHRPSRLPSPRQASGRRAGPVFGNDP